MTVSSQYFRLKPSAKDAKEQQQSLFSRTVKNASDTKLEKKQPQQSPLRLKNALLKEHMTAHNSARKIEKASHAL